MRWVLLIVAAVALAGCEAPPQGAGGPVCGTYSLGLEKTRIHPGDEAGLHVRLENCGTKALAIGLVPRCAANALGANVTVQGAAYEITQGAAQKVVPSGPSCANSSAFETLPPGHVRDLRLTWNGTLDDGAPAPPGTYTIAGRWTAAEDPNMTRTATILIEVI